MEIKVLGPGCAKCEQTAKIIQEVINELGVDTEIIKVKGAMEIAKHGVFITPAVVINGEVKCSGKVPGLEDVKSWIKE